MLIGPAEIFPFSQRFTGVLAAALGWGWIAQPLMGF
jgi:hypothetical protein